jgi:leucyl aminopeptidase
MAKSLINISVKAQKGDVFSTVADVLAVGVFSDISGKSLVDRLDKKLGGAVEKVQKLGDFEAKPDKSCLLYGEGKIAAKRILLVGMGKAAEFKTNVLRKAAALAATKAVDLKAKTLLLSLHTEIDTGAKTDVTEAGQTMAEGVCFGAFRYDEYMSEATKKRAAKIAATVIDSDAAVVTKLRKGILRGLITGEAQNFARLIANRPANVINPPALAAEARKMAQRVAGLRCTVLDEKQLKDKKMGGILAVGQGSKTPPRLIMLQYTPAKASKSAPTIGLVGKAVTFDSGGISIKPSEGMQDMKFDKSGGIAVLGAMQAIARLKPKVKVVGLIPSAENMPGTGSYRPGDIVTTFSGKTVEIQNTDAEGRMLLCDALAYAEKLGCSPIVDMATLTGACVVALGQKRAGLMGNDKALVEQLKESSAETGERLWHLPCDDEFVEAMKSKIADLKNVGGKWGGACTAAAFLSQFVNKAKWAHVDMAGVGVWGADEKDAPGSIGFGVRLLTSFVLHYS